jgi:hypothetical protein
VKTNSIFSDATRVPRLPLNCTGGALGSVFGLFMGATDTQARAFGQRGSCVGHSPTALCARRR